MATWRVKCIVSGGIQGYTTLLLNKFKIQTHNKNLFSKNLLQIYDKKLISFLVFGLHFSNFYYFSIFLLIFLILILDFIISVLVKFPSLET